jgi:Highly conserved protein containing a thioredoxin domain
MSNRLSQSTSPYLLQHAENPVDWYPWGEEAFEKARREEKPVFLSIGYSTCHWCHVMAHESFENPDVAAVLNEYFVSIKVDREERPDIDRLYMAFVQATTGSGGWPMSVWLTPDAQPFFGGTYFPPTSRHGRTGFITVLERIAEVWARERQRVVAQGAQVIEALREGSTPPPSGMTPGVAAIDAGLAAFASAYDAERGGFGGGPKFPRPAVFDFLFRIERSADAREMALNTLRKMAAGGIRDHVGGGFHRYAVDGKWHVPHFEKMLYDQAQLVCSFVDAWKISGDPALAEIARETLGYVSRCLTHPAGGFFSAEDADSLYEEGRPEHGEGAFYVWTMQQITDALGGDRAAVFCRHYGVEPNGNVDPASDPQGELAGRNVLFQRESVAETAVALGLSDEDVRDALAECRTLLAVGREKRPRPHLDDKILTAWNGLMISAFARAGAALGDGGYVEAAIRAANFVRTELRDKDTGRLLRSWRDGAAAAIGGFAEDYAFFVQALLDLHEATLDSAWLDLAIELQRLQDELFFDEAAGCYLGSAAGDSLVPVRMRDDYDGAEPSANAITALNLLRLGRMFHDDAFTARAARVIESFAQILEGMPSAVPKMLCALDMHHSPSSQAVVAGDPRNADTAALLRALHRLFAPNRVILAAGATEGTLGMTEVDGRAAVYLCENFTCKAPVTDPSNLGA